MATNFPTALDSYTTKIDNVDDVLAAHINDIQDAIVATETKVGVDNSSNTSSIDYKLRNLPAQDGTTVISNLNADLWDGNQFADYLDQGVRTTDSPSFAKLTANQTAAADSLLLQDDGVIVAEIYDGGIVDLPKQSGCSVERVSAQSIPDATPTKLEFDTVNDDVQGEWDSTNHRWIASKPGVVYVTVMVALSSPADGQRIISYIHKNGSASRASLTNVGGTGDAGATVSARIPVVAGDYIEGWCYQSAGSSKDTLTASGNYPYLDVNKIA